MSKPIGASFALLCLLAAQGCAAGKAAGNLTQSTTSAASRAMMRAAGLNPDERPAPSASDKEPHWSEEWVWEGDRP